MAETTIESQPYSPEELATIKKLLSPLKPQEYTEEELFPSLDGGEQLDRPETSQSVDEDDEDLDDTDDDDDDQDFTPPGLDFGDDEEDGDAPDTIPGSIAKNDVADLGLGDLGDAKETDSGPSKTDDFELEPDMNQGMDDLLAPSLDDKPKEKSDDADALDDLDDLGFGDLDDSKGSDTDSSKADDFELGPDMDQGMDDLLAPSLDDKPKGKSDDADALDGLDDLGFDDLDDKPAGDRFVKGSEIDLDPDSDQDDLDNLMESKPDQGTKKIQSGMDDLSLDMGLSDLEDFDKIGKPLSQKSGFSSGDLDSGGLPPLEDFDLGGQGLASEKSSAVASATDMNMDSLMDELSDEEPATRQKSGLLINDSDLEKVKQNLRSYSFGVRSSAKKIIIEELISPQEIEELISLVLHQAPEKQVKRFIEKKLRIKIDSLTAETGRKVIGSKKEYSLDGLRRKQRMVLYTRYAAALFIVGLLIGMISYRFVYKPLKAQSLFDKGTTLILKPGNEAVDKPKDYQKAEEYFQEGLEYSPEDIEAYNQFALAYLEKKKFDTAKAKLMAAQQLNQKNRNYDAETLYNLGLYHIESKSPRKLESDTQTLSWSKAARDYFRKANRSGKNLKAIEGIGRTYLLENDFGKAETYFKKILAEDPKNIIGHASLLNLYIDLDKLMDTMIVHRTIRDLKLEKNLNPYLRAKLGGYYLSQKDVRIRFNIQSDEKDQQDTLRPIAQDVLFSLSKDYPKFAEGRYQLARFFRELKSYKRAFRQLEEAVQLDPHHFRAHTMIASMLLERNEINEAYNHLRQALEAYNTRKSTINNPYHPKENIGETYSLLGHLFYYHPNQISRKTALDTMSEDKQNENLNLAVQYYKAAEKAGFTSPEQDYNFGRSLYLEGNYEGSLDKWLRLQGQLYTNPHLLFGLGNSFYRLGKLEAAQGEYKKLIDDYELQASTIPRVNSDDDYHRALYTLLSSAHNNLGIIYQKKNQEKEALTHFWKAIETSMQLNKENVHARLNLNRAIRSTKVLEEPVLDDNLPVYLTPMQKKSLLKY